MMRENGGRRALVRHFSKGDLILAAGSFCREALVVLRGEIEVHFPLDAGTDAPAALLHAGDVFGDIFLIRPGVCRAEVRARTDTAVRSISSAEFSQYLHRITGDDERGGVLHAVIRRFEQVCSRKLCEDLAVLLTPVDTGTGLPVESGVEVTLRLQPETPEAKFALDGRDAVTLTDFPVLLGRRSSHGTAELEEANVLLLTDAEPYQISRRHVLIRVERGIVVCEDAGSRLGSEVDGVRIGGGSNVRSVSLRAGRRRLQLGTPASPYRFRVWVAVGNNSATADTEAAAAL